MPHIKTVLVNLLISELSAKQLRQAANLKERIDSLQGELNHILGSSSLGAAVKQRHGAKPKRTTSAATKAKLAAVARARWKKAKAQGKSAL
jgi:hypothetical protein